MKTFTRWSQVVIGLREFPSFREARLSGLGNGKAYRFGPPRSKLDWTPGSPLLSGITANVQPKKHVKIIVVRICYSHR